MKKIRSMPSRAGIIADHILYLSDYVVGLNTPAKQLEHLGYIFDNMKQEPLPKSRDEFESRASFPFSAAVTAFRQLSERAAKKIFTKSLKYLKKCLHYKNQYDRM